MRPRPDFLLRVAFEIIPDEKSCISSSRLLSQKLGGDLRPRERAGLGQPSLVQPLGAAVAQGVLHERGLLAVEHEVHEGALRPGHGDPADEGHVPSVDPSRAHGHLGVARARAHGREQPVGREPEVAYAEEGCGGAGWVVTYNLKDFPAEALAPLGLETISPDAFLCMLLERDGALVAATMGRLVADKRHPPRTMAEELAGLRKNGLGGFADALEASLDGAGEAEWLAQTFAHAASTNLRALAPHLRAGKSELAPYLAPSWRVHILRILTTPSYETPSRSTGARSTS